MPPSSGCSGGDAIHDGGQIDLKHDVFLESLRDEARDGALLAELGLPP